VLAVIGGLFAVDVFNGRHVLSTKDGRFLHEVLAGRPDR